MLGAVTTLENLKTWFIQENKPYWTLYYNKDKKHTNATNFGETSTDDIEISFERFETVLKMLSQNGYSGWLFVRKTNNTSNTSGSEIGIQLMPAGFQNYPQMAGIGSLNMQPPTDVNTAIAAAKKEWDMERKLDELEAQINAPSTDWITRGTEIINGLMQNPILSGLAAKMAGLNIAEMAQVSGEMAHDSQTPIEESNDLETALEFFNEAGFNEKDLLKLSKFAKANPSVAKEMFKNLAQ